MTLRALFLADGPSDLPLSSHLEALCAEQNREVEVTPVDPRLLGAPGRSVEARLRHLLSEGVAPDLFFVHRDAENQPAALRFEEIRAGAKAAGVAAEAVVPVVPIRMTEAWLLIDEAEIRRVAGRPNRVNSLGLPAIGSVEGLANPKQALLEALLTAAGVSGRRRAQFVRDFGRHRALLLQRIDREGPINQFVAWKQLKSDVQAALSNLEPTEAPE